MKGCQQAVAPEVEPNDAIKRKHVYPTSKPDSLTQEKLGDAVVRGLGAGARLGGVNTVSTTY